jgi:transposase
MRRQRAELSIAAVPIPPNTLAALKRDLERHRIVKQQIREIEQTRLEVLNKAAAAGPHAMVLMLARVIGIGVETADMLVQEVLSRNMRDRRAVARYAGLTGSPDESGSKRRALASHARRRGARRCTAASRRLIEVTR